MDTTITPNGPNHGWYVYYLGKRHKITEISLDGLIYHLVNIDDGSLTEVHMNNLLIDIDPDSPPIIAPTLATLDKEIDMRFPEPVQATTSPFPDSFVDLATEIALIIPTIDQLIEDAKRLSKLREEHFSKTQVLKRALRQLNKPIGITSYYKYKKLHRKWHGDVAAMAASMRRQSYRQARLTPSTIFMVEIFIMRWRRKRRPLRVSTLYKLMDDALKYREGMWINSEKIGKDYPEDLINELLDPTIPTKSILQNPEKQVVLTKVGLPSRSWFYEYVRWYERFGEGGKEIFIAQHGKEAYEAEHHVFDTFVRRAAFPLQYVFVDHWIVDVFTVDEDTRTEVIRLWFTAGIDAYSRSIVGMALLDEEPCIESVLTWLKHAIWPKTSHTQFGIEEPYICWGVPMTLFLDNAWAHHSNTLRQLAIEIGHDGKYPNIQLMFRPPYKATRGALIESLFGNLSGRMKELVLGAIKSSNPSDVRNAAKEAALIYEDINRFLHHEVVQYQHTIHSDLDGMTPHSKWLEGIRLMRPKAPPLTPQLERKFLRLLNGSRVINKDGIRAFGLCYKADELSGLTRKKGRKSTKYFVRYDPNDIHRVCLFSENGIWLCDIYASELRLPDGTYRSLSLWEKKVAGKIAKDAGDSSRNWLLYIDQIENMNFKRRTEKRRMRRRKQPKTNNKKTKQTKQSIRKVDNLLENVDQDDGYEGYTDLLAGFMGSNDDIDSE